jgi:8-oxo-dGTP diphosphatase
MKAVFKKKMPRIRLAGVVVRNGKILLVRHERDKRSYYLLPGGGLEWGETCAAGLKREFMEELSLEISVGKLLLINESIAPQGKRHILNLTFAASLQKGILRVQTDRRLKAATWVTPQELRQLHFYPEIRQALLQAWKQGFKKGMTLVPTPWK